MIKFGRFIVKHRVLVLVCYGAIKKTTHRSILPDVGRLSGGIMKHYRVFILLFLLLVGPAIYGYNHTTVYYNLDSTLPEELDSSRANKSLTEDFKMGALHLLLLDNDRCKNITVDHGMVENDGDHSVVVCYGMPGLTESLALEDTENFEAS